MWSCRLARFHDRKSLFTCAKGPEHCAPPSSPSDHGERAISPRDRPVHPASCGSCHGLSPDCAATQRQDAVREARFQHAFKR